MQQFMSQRALQRPAIAQYLQRLQLNLSPRHMRRHPAWFSRGVNVGGHIRIHPKLDAARRSNFYSRLRLP